MSESLYAWLVYATLGGAALVQAILLALQVDGIRRSNALAFRLLATGSVFGLIYTGFIVLPYVITMDTKVATALYVVAILSLLPSYAFGLAGSFVLFRAFHQLTARGAQSGADCDIDQS